ncbi:MAG: amino acid permease [Planctomycetota bacterium]|nr:MAG: amino acid permease [Planctomycetota bacterium]
MTQRATDSTPPALARRIGLFGAVALVVVNMVGSSVYTLPASLAKSVGPLALVAWLATALGYVLVASVYARLGARFPRSGGPYEYARRGFGDAAGFTTAWAYWWSATIGNAAIASSAAVYAPELFPSLRESPVATFAIALACVWALCGLNLLGVRAGIGVQSAIFVAALVPLAAVGALGLAHFEPANLEPFAPSGWSALPAGMALVVWAYAGIESAAVTAEEVVAPGATIPRSTWIGFALGTLVYLGLALALIGALDNAALASSGSPLALLAERCGAPWLARGIAVTAIAACLGTLNGWILLSGRIPVAAAQDGLFPAALARVTTRTRAPAVALVAGALVTSAALAPLLVAKFQQAFQLIVQLSLFLTLVPHLFAAAAGLRFAADARERAIAGGAFAVVLLFTIGCGKFAALAGAAVILAGLALHVAAPRGRSGGVRPA